MKPRRLQSATILSMVTVSAIERAGYQRRRTPPDPAGPRDPSELARLLVARVARRASAPGASAPMAAGAHDAHRRNRQDPTEQAHPQVPGGKRVGAEDPDEQQRGHEHDHHQPA